MVQMLNFFERIINSLSSLWNFLTRDYRMLELVNKYFPDKMKPLILKFLPDDFLELNFLIMISASFIIFLLVWSFVKLFTNIV